MNKINPTHYTDSNGKQCIDYMLEKFGYEELRAFCELNAYKYRFRAGKKDGEQYEDDIEKATWYENKIKELDNKYIWGEE